MTVSFGESFVWARSWPQWRNGEEKSDFVKSNVKLILDAMVETNGALIVVIMEIILKVSGIQFMRVHYDILKLTYFCRAKSQILPVQ